MSREEWTAAPIVLVGYKARLMPLAEGMIEKPTLPANITKEETEKKWYADTYPVLLKKRYDEASYRPVTGSIEELCVIDGATGEYEEAPRDNGSVWFQDWLWNHGFEPSQVRLVGFDIRQFASISGVEAIAAGLSVPPGYWGQPSSHFNPVFNLRIDPYHAIISSEDHRKTVSLNTLLSSLGIKFPSNWEPHNDAVEDARITAELAAKLGLLVTSEGTPSNWTISTMVAHDHKKTMALSH